ncbi:ankyrin repeats (3 copies) domain-containing protein [Cordyceps javanica]|uniref:Ankyrin repeats (3 copies) domain-containing protein n=1 Tax=Cordyceps javanica TaxID=43265 RepID=A0A545VEP4_9HYPO|nr:ankyrin repeats (3 copies) domain-containing protein [Cordyceps javanica]TQW11394.1 ankyrin repeats (3 copies) domain-containing protein [Cordyceps javanica]
MDAPVALDVYAILTPLAVALSEGNVAVAEVLLREGAYVNGFGTASRRKRGYYYRRHIHGPYSCDLTVEAKFGKSFTAEEWQKWARAGYDYSDLLAASSPLQMAALSRSVQFGRVLLNIGALPDGFGGFGTALQVASARMNNLSFVELLLENGAKINAPAQEPRGRTALQAAVEFGSNDTVQFLLSAGADINALPSRCGFTALQAAARTQDTELVVQLIGLGADVNAPPAAESGRTALQAAVEGQNTDLIDALLDSGADISASPAQSGGLSALEAGLSNHHVLEKLLSRGSASGLLPKLQTEGRALFSTIAKHHYGRLGGPILQSLVTLLVRYGMNATEYDFQDLLRSAFNRSDMDMLNLLMTNGAAANVTNHELQVLLRFAVQNANIHFTKMLLDAGADVNLLPSDPKGQPLIAVAAATGSQSLCELLIEHNADLKGYAGTKALCAAVSTGSMETLKFLLSEGASPNWGDQENQLHQNGHVLSPLAACFNYYTRETMAIVLLEHGAQVRGVAFPVEVCEASMSMLARLIGLGLDVNLRLSPKSQSMLQYEVHCICILNLLIDAGAELHSLPGGGRWGSPLQIAVEHSNLCLVKYLLSKGADVNEPPNSVDGAPALQQAIIAGSLPMFCLLIDNGADVNAVVAPIGQTALEQRQRTRDSSSSLSAGSQTGSFQWFPSLGKGVAAVESP